MHVLRSATALLLAAGAVAATAASAAPVESSQTLFARQEGCGATQQAGRLETSRGTDGADGCGTIGGLPLNEAIGAAPELYATGEAYKPVTVRAGAVKGQVAADSWIGTVGGVGTVEVDIAMSGVTADGESVELGSTTVSAPASPTTTTVKIPFALAVPAEAQGLVVEGWSLSVTLRGRNVNANAQALDGDVFVTLPTLKP